MGVKERRQRERTEIREKILDAALEVFATEGVEGVTMRALADAIEYTPPVIYSKESRAKLVFLVEAKPGAQDAARLHPGQPVDVRLP